MKVIDHLNAAKGTLFSFEILPPLKGRNIESLYEGIDPLMEFNPSFINVTYHREDFIYKEQKNGLLQKIRVKKRPGTIGICASIKEKYKTDTVPHLICGGFSKEETEDALIELNFLGIDNVLALRGDPISSEQHFLPEKDGHRNAVGLVQQIKKLNSGIYLHEEEKEASATNFCIGAACYPEKHPEALNLKTDIDFLKQKVDAGAEYLVTQMFFDNSAYFSFVEKCRSNGIMVPIIPGLKPLTTLRHLNFVPKIFKVDLPEELSKELIKCKTNDAVKEVGVEWGVTQSKALVEGGAPCLHYYTMGRSDSVKKIVSQVF